MKLGTFLSVALAVALLATPSFAQAPTGPEEKLTHDQITATVNSHVADIKACMKENGAVTGQVIIEFGIMIDGHVVDAKVKEASSNRPLDKCILGAFRKWQFPKRGNGPIQGVDYPLVFTPPKPAAPIKQTSPEEQKAIEGVINSHMPEVRKCYETALVDKDDLKGEIDMDMVINAAGSVVSTKIGNNTVKYPKLEKCIGDAVLKWVFPKHTGIDITITYPFVLKGLEKKK